jgi:hypothetical protein
MYSSSQTKFAQGKPDLQHLKVKFKVDFSEFLLADGMYLQFQHWGADPRAGQGMPKLSLPWCQWLIFYTFPAGTMILSKVKPLAIVATGTPNVSETKGHKSSQSSYPSTSHNGIITLMCLQCLYGQKTSMKQHKPKEI